MLLHLSSGSFPFPHNLFFPVLCVPVFHLPPGEADVEVAGFTEEYVFVVIANGSLVEIQLDRASVEVVVEDKGWCRWRVSTFVLYQEREG